MPVISDIFNAHCVHPVGETGESWDRGELGHCYYLHEATLAIESVYLFTDIQDLMLVYWCDIECGRHGDVSVFREKKIYFGIFICVAVFVYKAITHEHL